MLTFSLQRYVKVAVQIEEGLFVVCKELEGAVGVLAAWRECGMFAVNGRPYITPF